MFTEVTIRTTGISIPTVYITTPTGTVARTEAQARKQGWVSTWNDMAAMSRVSSTYPIPSDTLPLLFSQGITGTVSA